MEVQSPSKDQEIVESSEAESSDSDDDYPLVSLVPKHLEKETIQETEAREMSPPPIEDIGDYSDPIPDMAGLIARAAETLDNMTEVNYALPLTGPLRNCNSYSFAFPRLFKLFLLLLLRSFLQIYRIKTQLRFVLQLNELHASLSYSSSLVLCY